MSASKHGQAFCSILSWALLAVIAGGCRSPYYADQGAVFGGLTGAGVGALVGNAVGNTGAGAVIGAGVGALTGSAVGAGLDDIEARNRAEIEARLGRPVVAGAVSMDEVVAMTRAGVTEEVIATHVQTHGVVRPLTTADIIYLQNNQVSSRVIQVMQQPPAVAPVVMQPVPPPPMVVHTYGPPVYYHHHPAYCRPCPPRVGVGFSYTHR